MAVIVIDPGHGGTRMVGGSSPNNATGPAGTKEKTLTLAIGLAARTALTARGHTVFMTRTRDVNLGLAARAHVARDHRAAAFVSIHLNASDKHTAQGTETWLHTRHSARSKRLADRVQASVLAVTKWRDRGVKAKRLGVLSPNSHDPQTACCLVPRRREAEAAETGLSKCGRECDRRCPCRACCLQHSGGSRSPRGRA